MDDDDLLGAMLDFEVGALPSGRCRPPQGTGQPARHCTTAVRCRTLAPRQQAWAWRHRRCPPRRHRRQHQVGPGCACLDCSPLLAAGRPDRRCLLCAVRSPHPCAAPSAELSPGGQLGALADGPRRPPLALALRGLCRRAGAGPPARCAHLRGREELHADVWHAGRLGAGEEGGAEGTGGAVQSLHRTCECPPREP